MPRRPEIGNVQLYPDRPLRRSDRNGYVLKFYCPIRCQRIRRNCGTRDRTEARRLQRECQKRLLNGDYVASDGAITAEHAATTATVVATDARRAGDDAPGYSWEHCQTMYLEHRAKRVRDGSLDDIRSRLGIAERIFEAQLRDQGKPDGIQMSAIATLEQLEFLQMRLLDGEHCRYDDRSPNTVNSLMGAVMAFLRFCKSRSLVPDVPALEKLPTDEVMKGRPITEGEFQRMLEATESVVGKSSAPSWIFALKVLWESSFRVGDLMDFSWNDPRHIVPVWPSSSDRYSSIAIPSSQKNGQIQEIPMLPGLEELLSAVPEENRTGWVVDPRPVEFEFPSCSESFRPNPKVLVDVASRYTNVAISKACGVSETAVRKWLAELPHQPDRTGPLKSKVSERDIQRLQRQPDRVAGEPMTWTVERMTVERVSRIICRIGKQAGVIVQHADKRTGQRQKFASAHDIRRGCARRLINSGVSAETLKVIMRHASFATTEKHYGAIRSTQTAAAEIASRLRPQTHENSAFVGGLVGGTKKAPQLSAEELVVLKSLLAKL